jgi:hypothetical protein
VTDDDVIIGMELKDRKKKLAELERERKSRIEITERREAALVVLDRLDHEIGSEVDKLCDNDLKTLLRWKGVPASKMGLVSKKRAIYKKMVEDGNGVDNDSNNPAPWTDEDENELEHLKTAQITISNTAYGRFKAQKKRDAVLAYKRMSPEERSAFLRQCAELDAADDAPAAEESAPTNITPV